MKKRFTEQQIQTFLKEFEEARSARKKAGLLTSTL